MFYMKHKGTKLEIRDDNVYSMCPECGREYPVDLHDILSCEHSDLYGTAVYCEKCSAQRMKDSPV